MGHDAIHDLVQDLVRVTKELGYIPKRDEYLKHGKFSRRAIDIICGSWSTALQAAGLKYLVGKQTPAEMKFEREQEKYDRRDYLFKKFDVEIKPYHGKFDRLNKDIFSIACISDSHSNHWDEFTWEVFLDHIKEAQPDLIVLGGDNLEFYKLSRYSKNPQRALDMQKEIDFVVEKKLKAIRALCPKAQIDYHIGNHEARLFAYLCDNSPALSSLRCLQFDQLLSLNDLEINLIGRESFVFQTKMEDNYKVYRGLWAWTHGTDCTLFPAHKEMQRHGVSGASGHCHRFTSFAKRDVNGFKSWVSVGASCTIKHGGEFIPSLINWETGFLLSYVHPNGVTQQHVSTEGGFACVGGKFYKRKQVS